MRIGSCTDFWDGARNTHIALLTLTCACLIAIITGFPCVHVPIAAELLLLKALQALVPDVQPKLGDGLNKPTAPLSGWEP